MRTNKRLKKETWQKTLKEVHSTAPKKFKTALKDTHTGCNFLKMWENMIKQVKYEERA